MPERKMTDAERYRLDALADVVERSGSTLGLTQLEKAEYAELGARWYREQEALFSPALARP